MRASTASDSRPFVGGSCDSRELSKLLAKRAVGRPWLRWNFVPPEYASGALVEVAQRYQIEDGAWAPVEGDPQ